MRFTKRHPQLPLHLFQVFANFGIRIIAGFLSERLVEAVLPFSDPRAWRGQKQRLAPPIIRREPFACVRFTKREVLRPPKVTCALKQAALLDQTQLARGWRWSLGGKAGRDKAGGGYAWTWALDSGGR